jgi:hypothetical protein
MNQNIAVQDSTGISTRKNSVPIKIESHESPDERNLWPPSEAKLMAAIHQALAWSPPTITAPIFDFRLTVAAADANAKTLATASNDLQTAILKDPNSPLRPGSEFRPAKLLSPIFTGHPLWKRMERTLLEGATMPLEPISEKDRLQLLQTAQEYGNHKSARRDSTALLKILEGEVEKGWQLPLPINTIGTIPHLLLGPLGLVKQMTIDERGNPKPKFRVTHDQSFQYQQDDIPSVNQRVQRDKLSGSVYGFALSRFLHAIITLRLRLPHTAILLTKFDFKSAYRRVHFHGSSAIQSCITTIDLEGAPDVVLACLRTTFGGTPNPFIFSEVSEPVADLSNAVKRCETWEPGELTPRHTELIGEPIIYSPAETEFATARPLLVNTEIDENGTTEVFIDDLMSAFPALSPNHITRCALAPLLALDVIARPNTDHEPLKRDAMLSIDKAQAEGTPTERLTILGWMIDTRKLEISLPDEKFQDWSTELTTIITAAKKGHPIKHKTIEKMLGRLQHAALVLTEGNHFLNRIRSAEQHALIKNLTAVRLTAETRHDLTLWHRLLARANKGIDINLLVTRKPDWISRTDACEYGLGGYSLTTGRAWRWAIPPELQLRKSINFLEFLACVAEVLIAIPSDNIQPSDCLVSVGDNTTALGWIRKSNFADAKEQTTHSALARNFATTTVEAGLCQRSQWFPGVENQVADLLSRDLTTPDTILTQRIHKLYPSQISPEFRIYPTPPDLDYLLHYWVRHGPETTESPPAIRQRPFHTFETFAPSSTVAKSEMTSTSKNSHSTTATSSSAHTHTQSEPRNFPRVQKEMTNWLQIHAKPPSMLFVRPSASTANPTRPWIRMENFRYFYHNKSKDTATTTLRRDHKKRSHSI